MFFVFILAAIDLAQRGAIAIIGPKNLPDFEATQRLCKQLDVPQVAIQVSGLSSFNNPCNNEYVLRMTPADLPQLGGIVAFIKHFGWKRVAVIASSDKSETHFAEWVLPSVHERAHWISSKCWKWRS